jgi:hypothetical protein
VIDGAPQVHPFAGNPDHHLVEVDLLRKSGEFPVSNEELDDTATTVYEGF